MSIYLIVATAMVGLGQAGAHLAGSPKLRSFGESLSGVGIGMLFFAVGIALRMIEA